MLPVLLPFHFAVLVNVVVPLLSVARWFRVRSASASLAMR